VCTRRSPPVRQPTWPPRHRHDNGLRPFPRAPGRVEARGTAGTWEAQVIDEAQAAAAGLHDPKFRWSGLQTYLDWLRVATRYARDRRRIDRRRVASTAYARATWIHLVVVSDACTCRGRQSRAIHAAGLPRMGACARRAGPAHAGGLTRRRFATALSAPDGVVDQCTSSGFSTRDVEVQPRDPGAAHHRMRALIARVESPGAGRRRHVDEIARSASGEFEPVAPAHARRG